MSYNTELQENNAELEAILDAVNELPESTPDEAVLYTKQTLTEEQKAQARKNIGAQAELTDADKEEIVQQVITALGTPVFGRVEEGNKITLSTEHLADGTYYLGYEDKDGNWVEICAVEIGGMGDSGSIELVWADGVKLDKNTGVENTVNGEYAASQHIELVDGYTYTFSQTVYGGVNICYYDANGTGLGYELLWDGVDGVKTKALTPIAGAATFRVRLYYGLNTTIEEAKDRYSLTYEKTA